MIFDQALGTLRWIARMWDVIALGIVALLALSAVLRVGLPYVTPKIRRAIARPSYKRHAKRGLLTVPLRIADHDAYKRPSRYFDKFSERHFGGITEAFPVVMRKSLGIFGASGQGKSELIRCILYAIRQHPSPIPLIIFDTKGEYEELLFNSEKMFGRDLFPDVEVVKLSSTDSTHTHNLLAEAAHPDEFREIVQLMFGKPKGDSQQQGNPFFSDTAVHLLEALIRCYVDQTDFSKKPNERTTWGFLDFVHRYDADTLEKIVKRHDDPSISSASKYIDPKSERQQVGVYATLLKNINNAFIGDFAGDSDDMPEEMMSIREFFHDPQDRILLISRPPEAAESLDMIFQFLLDWAMKLSLSDEHPAVFLYDEFPEVPALRYIQQLAAQGRARNSIGVFGVQDVSQLYDIYGVEGGKAIMSSMTQQVFLGSNSEGMAQFASKQIGTHGVLRRGTKQTENGETISGEWTVNERILKANTFDEWESGHCAVKTKRKDGKRWAYGKLARLKDVHRKYAKTASSFPPFQGTGERVDAPYLTSAKALDAESDETDAPPAAPETEQTNGDPDAGEPDHERPDPEPPEPEPPVDEPLSGESAYDLSMSDAERTLHDEEDSENGEP